MKKASSKSSSKGKRKASCTSINIDHDQKPADRLGVSNLKDSQTTTFDDKNDVNDALPQEKITTCKGRKLTPAEPSLTCADRRTRNSCTLTILAKVVCIVVLLVIFIGYTTKSKLLSNVSHLLQGTPSRGSYTPACLELKNASIAGDRFARELYWAQNSDNSRSKELVRGVHIHENDYFTVREHLERLEKCCSTSLTLSTQAITSIEALRTLLELPLKRNGGRGKCFMYVLKLEHVTPKPVANALKELLENNALQSSVVFPSRALVIVLSAKTKEDLKDVLPHRVVHLLRYV